MDATTLAKMYAARIVAEDKRACSEAFEGHWQQLAGCGMRRETVEGLFELGWAARANWSAEMSNPVADQTPARAI